MFLFPLNVNFFSWGKKKKISEHFQCAWPSDKSGRYDTEQHQVSAQVSHPGSQGLLNVVRDII